MLDSMTGEQMNEWMAYFKILENDRAMSRKEQKLLSEVRGRRRR